MLIDENDNNTLASEKLESSKKASLKNWINSAGLKKIHRPTQAAANRKGQIKFRKRKKHHEKIHKPRSPNVANPTVRSNVLVRLPNFGHF